MKRSAVSRQPGEQAEAKPEQGAAGRSVGQAIIELGATELSGLIHARQVSCREVMQAYLDQIARFNPKVNAIVSLQDPDILFQQAEERDRQLAGGTDMGWMHGFPQAPKDLASTAGIVTTQGSPILKNTVSKTDAIIVERARRCGAILVGKTNTPEFGLGSHTYNAVFGTTRNAYNQSKTAGGSSGGAAVALALRMLPVADGSDMMGSLRNPAGYNNVYGFRPSLGTVPYGPTTELFMQQLACEGPMARSVTDLAMLLSVQAGYDARVPMSVRQDTSVFARSLAREFKGARIAWLGDFDGYLPMEAGVIDLARSALQHFDAIGCIVDEARPNFDMASLWQAWLVLRGCLIAGKSGGLYRNAHARALLKPEAVWEIERGLALSGSDVYKASETRSAWYAALQALFETYDFLVLPTAQVFPFDANLDWPKAIAGKPMDSYHRWMEIVIGATMAGLPVINVPAGFSASGLPMGLQVIGKPRDDLSVLQIAHAYEQAAPYGKCRPALLDAS
jgi:amidase